MTLRTTAVVPVKGLDHAKRRLAGLLGAEERKALFTAMVRDVITALRGCGGIHGILVITNDAEVAALAGEYEAEILAEPPVPGLIESVTEAGRVLSARGVERMLFVPGDIPLLTTAELDRVLQEAVPEQTGQDLFFIVPARDLGGSNCVVCAPPDCMTFGFGVDSYHRHLRLAAEAGVPAREIRLPGIGLDVDTPEDIAELLRELEAGAVDSHTHRTLRALGVATRPALTPEAKPDIEGSGRDQAPAGGEG